MTVLQVFIPELGQTFQCPPSFHLFAAQNPLQEGGGRKGLPKSFLNRFSRVYIQLLQSQDLLFIAGEPFTLLLLLPPFVLPKREQHCFPCCTSCCCAHI